MLHFRPEKSVRSSGSGLEGRLAAAPDFPCCAPPTGGRVVSATAEGEDAAGAPLGSPLAEVMGGAAGAGALGCADELAATRPSVGGAGPERRTYATPTSAAAMATAPTMIAGARRGAEGSGVRCSELFTGGAESMVGPCGSAVPLETKRALCFCDAIGG